MFNDYELSAHRQQHLPALTIPINEIVPSVLHIMLGLVSNLWQELENMAKSLDKERDQDSNLAEMSETEVKKVNAISESVFDKLQEVLISHGIDKSAYFNKFNGKFTKIKFFGKFTIKNAHF